MRIFKVIPKLWHLGFTLFLICIPYRIAQADRQAVISQGDAIVHADLARASYALDGTGISVGVVSDSFNCLDGAAAGRQQGELPGEVVVLQEADCSNESSLDEGRAMLEIIHDLAPKAKLLFHAMGNNTIEFSQALNRLADNGSQIIVDDAVFFQEPMFQDGLAAQTIEKLVFERHIAYFSSAGNAGKNAYQAEFSGSQSHPLGPKQGIAHNFDLHPKKVDTCQSLTMGADSFTVLSLQWDQPAKSINSSTGSASDLDVVFYEDTACNKISTERFIGGSTHNLGADPIEVAGYDNKGNRQRKTIGMRIILVAGSEPKLMKYVLSGSSLPSEHPRINEYPTPNADASVFGHANANGAFSVGAVEPVVSKHNRQWQSSYYSSSGGAPILFNRNGERLAEPLIRPHIDAVAPTNINTSFFTATRPDVEKDGKPNFTGTSAAVPHAAATAALLLQAAAKKNINLSPPKLYELLHRSSKDLGPPGYDFATGYGLIQADRAIGLLNEEPLKPLARQGHPADAK